MSPQSPSSPRNTPAPSPSRATTPASSTSSTSSSAKKETAHPSSSSPPPPSSELEATDAMCYHCFVTLSQELQQGDSSSNNSKSSWRAFRNKRPIPEYVKALSDPSIECPLFITWDKLRPKASSLFPSNLLLRNNNNASATETTPATPIYELRGCIGSLTPKPLLTSIGDYALNSALRDRRFHPVTASEVPQLRVAVSLLVKYEVCDHCLDWHVGKHGILIRFTTTITTASSGSSNNSSKTYSATYLPEVASEQGWDQRQAVTALVRKSGYSGKVDQKLLDTIDCTRYQSSKRRMTYDEFVNTRKRKRQQLTPSTSASSSFHQQDVEEEGEEGDNDDFSGPAFRRVAFSTTSS
ncbi:AMME syndrome candidate gene 1 protein homolog [Seminavis robusta]|uniref:AMME syndrome candidate gene 1 protein homolog n=1 Tax=Seminavis robusta TaxID=568900 RepID=A0A9N8H1P8_9STRA|nr:AMME syndrome candidate gene 1 protein homolog [Seminavis robusta]|eukprot:Sro6_g005130.1 AMME syndrome candidate gene 1 protein homolog (353) ;mRNA; r:105582-106923